MARTNEREDCTGCFWEDICKYGQPCKHYILLDIDEELAKRAERRRRAQFYSDWNEYIEYHSDENTFF